MNEHDRGILNQFADRVRKHIPTAQIWAFGSRAREDARPDSDLDICVVVEDITPELRRIISYAAWETGFENDLLITTLKYSREQFENSPRLSSPLFQAIRSEGIAV